MGKNKRYFTLAGLLILIVGLTGCLNNSSPEEKIYDTLEEVASLEKDFKEQQEPLQKLEEEDNEIYGKIIQLGMKELEEIQALSNDAIEGIEKRKDLMEKEKAAINNAKERFKDIDGQIKELEDTSLQTEANNLKEIRTNRFDAYDELHNYYTTSLKQETELYELFKEKDAAKEDLEAKIEEINKTYNSLMDSNKRFNELTNE